MNRQKDTNSLNMPDEPDSKTSGAWVDIKDNPISDWYNFTVTAWVKPKYTSADNITILMLGVDNTKQFHLSLDGKGTAHTNHELGFSYESGGAQSLTRFSSQGSDNSSSAQTDGCPAGEWTHVAVVLSSGTTTSANGAGTALTDSSKNWPTNVWADGEVHNEDDDDISGNTDSHAVVTSNTATTITHAKLTQGDNNDWGSGDEYVVAKLYINGVATDVHNPRNTGFVDNIDDDTNVYYVGYMAKGGKHFDGFIDDVCIYDGKLLTADEVKRNYKAGKRSHR